MITVSVQLCRSSKYVGRYTEKNIRISTDILWRVFHILTDPVCFRRFTDTNVYGTGSVKIWKTRHKISRYTDIFYSADTQAAAAAGNVKHTHRHTHTGQRPNLSPGHVMLVY